MRTYPAAEDVTIAVPLTRSGEPFVPTGGNVPYKLHDADGAVLDNGTIADVTDTTVDIPVTAAHLVLSAGHVVEKRTLILSGPDFNIRWPFRISAFLNYASTPADVRAFIGCDDGELGDEEIDLVAAYIDVLNLFEGLEAALAGVPSLSQAAERAIVAQTVVSLLPSLPQRLSKSDSDGTSQLQRFDLDFDALEEKARRALANALSVLNGTDAKVLPLPLLVGAVRQDPLTGN